MRVYTPSRTVSCADAAGTNEPHCAMTHASAVCRMKHDFPPCSARTTSAGFRPREVHRVGHERLPPASVASRIGCRPSRIRIVAGASSSSGRSVGRQYRPVAPTRQRVKRAEPRGGANRRANGQTRPRNRREGTDAMPPHTTPRGVRARVRAPPPPPQPPAGGTAHFYSYSRPAAPRRGHPGKRIRKLDQVFHLRDGDVRQSRGE